MTSNYHLIIITLQLLTIGILCWMAFRSKAEPLCVRQKYGFVNTVPESNYPDASLALVERSSLGQAPLGDPQYWLPNRSPITQGMYGLYEAHELPLSEVQPFDRKSLLPEAEAIPVYTEKPLQATC